MLFDSSAIRSFLCINFCLLLLKSSTILNVGGSVGDSVLWWIVLGRRSTGSVCSVCSWRSGRKKIGNIWNIGLTEKDGHRLHVYLYIRYQVFDWPYVWIGIHSELFHNKTPKWTLEQIFCFHYNVSRIMLQIEGEQQHLWQGNNYCLLMLILKFHKENFHEDK